MSVSVCVLEVCTSACDGHGGVEVGVGGGLQAIFPKTLQLSPRLNSAERQRSFSSLFIISSVFTYLCLTRKKKSVLKGAISCGEGF